MHPWEENVRELKNILERTLVLAHEGALRVEHFKF